MNRYKITISNRNLYKEIELSPDMECLTIGTTVNDDVRIHKALLFENIKLTLKRVNLQWTVICSENIYLNFGDSRKLLNSKLENGMQFKVCYQESDNNIFDVVYAIDFDYEKKTMEDILIYLVLIYLRLVRLMIVISLLTMNICRILY